MAPPPFTPYTYIQCPCSDSAGFPRGAVHEAASRPSSSSDRKPGGGHAADGEADDEDDRTFDPRSPRANYSLYPLEHLLYCEDCHQIRCPRCVAEEIVTYYCPNCLFEVPTSNLKSEGNRCTRSCFQCPVCIAPLTVTSVETPASGATLAVPDGGPGAAGSFVLSCSYCQWTSTEIGIKFDKANGVYGQLAKMRNGGKPRLTPQEAKGRRRELGSSPSALSSSMAVRSVAAPGAGEAEAEAAGGPPQEGGPAPGPAGGSSEDGLDLETQFVHLKQFYQRQLAEASGAGVGGLSAFGDLGFGSPASLSRIMSMYTSGLAGGAGAGARFDKKAQSRVRSMREARDESEGFQADCLDESAALARLHGSGGPPGGAGASGSAGWDVTTSAEQRAAQSTFVGDDHQHGRVRFLDELRPIPFLLRTKRSKRCPICRHIISKPEAKATNSRFRIRLVAGSYIPSISIRPLQSATAAAAAAAAAAATPSSSRTAAAAAAATQPPTNILEPLKPVQYLLTFKNPIFESVKVTLATPSTTPGRFASKVTVLCPQFEIDSNTDVWDDALRDSNAGSGGRRGGDGGPAQQPQPQSQQQQQQQHGGQAMAGKIWERGRNWVSIVVEVVPPSLSLDLLAMTSKGGGGAVDLSPLREDEDVVEIPMFVRVEWETDAGQDGVGVASGRDKDVKEKRELAYWCVLGIGRVRHD